ncbi:hypothetical protein JG687_00012078 [Phytophthora cactorum]|uniref:Uncharacterized protein n=1 Tax=Phytophthora cactorum TaxID=29920 RepID=A0A8T1U2T8_9STRA|nr:hypothetical protein GQ600_6081 [Phytophthora cactorum]KAF1783965.1 hypothetical protein GQ600_8524 [Phytophthora cactorum]KAG6953972.1 hypothetical protein JG687_00012078 [Phytophthora cactorum]
MSSSILLVLSTGAAILAVLAPFPDFWRIYKTRSTGSVSVLPVVLIFCNCYAGFGMLASIVFGGIFNYHWTRDHARIHKLYGAAFYVLSGYTLYYSLGTSGATNQSSEAVENTLGGTDLALYASPLETIKNVFETKDASTIPITISAFFLANGIVWEVHSIAEDDMLVRDRSRVVCRPSSATSKDLSKLFQYN